MSQPFAVVFELAGPIIMDRGIGLPGLLARLLADGGESDPLAHLPLDQRGNIFLGSDLFGIGPAVEYRVSYVRSLRPTAMATDIALHEKRNRAALDQITLRDERKNLLDSRRATGAEILVAFGAGDPERVESLLSDLGHIGAKRSSGYGAIKAVRLLPIDHPHAGLADRDGNPMRPVPVALWRGMNLPPRPVRNLVAGLPRWAAPREPCVGPLEWVMETEGLQRELGA